MAFQQINLGTANQGDGDSLRSGGDKVNDNFGEIYNKLGSGSGAGATLSTGSSVVTLTSPVINTGISGTAIKDEDDMSSDSDTHLATQQSIKAFVDSRNLGDLNNVAITAIADAQLIIYDNSQARFENITVSGDIAITKTGVTNIQANTITSLELASNVSLQIQNSSGTALKTIHGAGS